MDHHFTEVQINDYLLAMNDADLAADLIGGYVSCDARGMAALRAMLAATTRYDSNPGNLAALAYALSGRIRECASLAYPDTIQAHIEKEQS